MCIICAIKFDMKGYEGMFLCKESYSSFYTQYILFWLLIVIVLSFITRIILQLYGKH